MLGVSGGLVPCPSALVVLLSATALHQVAFGLSLIGAFGLGLAGVLTAVGIAVIYAHRYLGGRDLLPGWFLLCLPKLSAVAILVVGAVIATPGILILAKHHVG